MSRAIENPAEAFNRLFIEGMLPRANEMGIRIVEARRGYAEATVPMDGNTNHLGTMYAGPLFAVAEILGGAVLVANFDIAKFTGTVKEVKINFRQPARTAVTAMTSISDERLDEVRTELEANGKGDFTLEARILDEAGELVGETMGTYQVRKGKSPGLSE